MNEKSAVDAVREGRRLGPARKARAGQGAGGGSLRRLLFVFLAAAFALRGRCSAEDVSVTLSVDNGVQHIHGSFQTPVSSAAAWDVISDYGRLPEFVDSMKESRVLAREQGKTTVEQIAQGHFLFIKRSVQVTLKIAETPFSQLNFLDVSGKDFSFYEGSWRIEPDGKGCRVVYDLKAQLRTALPDAILKGLFRRQAADLLAAVRLEMSKRASPRSGPGPME